MSAIQGNAVLRITANSRYRLWLNGVEVGRGPSPSYPRWQYYSRGCTYGGPKEVADPFALCHDDDTCAVVTPLNPQDGTVLTPDFGRNLVGFFELDIADCAGGVLDIAYGESLNVTDVDRVELRSGRQVYSPFERRAGRYLVLTFRDLGGPVRIRHVRCLRQSYPVEPRGEFLCSDQRLNQIWEAGRYTVQMCMQDHYEDCPWREQTLYTGDLAVSAPLS